jgi:hypothetical protein
VYSLIRYFIPGQGASTPGNAQVLRLSRRDHQVGRNRQVYYHNIILLVQFLEIYQIQLQFN